MVAGLDEAKAKGLKLFLLDETVFSFSTFPTRTWYSKHNNNSKTPKPHVFRVK